MHMMRQLGFLPKEAHCSLICGQTGCGKTVFVLDLLQTVYKDHFEMIVVFCPTLKYNKSYIERKFIWTDDNIIIVDPSDQLSTCLDFYFKLCEGRPTLFIIDDCSAERDIVRKRHALSKLAFSGRHAQISVWLLTQKYNSVLTDFREQIKVLVLFHMKDRDGFDLGLRENDVITDKQDRDQIKIKLRQTLHSKLILKTTPPTRYCIVK